MRAPGCTAVLLLSSFPSICAFGVTPGLQTTATRNRSSSGGSSMRLDMSGESVPAVDRRDVLAWLGAAAAVTQLSPAYARDFYLEEPTDEFKESERQRMEFKKKQIETKKKFTTVLDRLSDESKTEEQLVKDLEDLRGLVIETGGLPLGIKKEGLFKQIRTKKASGFWPTNVEIAYQSLKNEISFQQSPNTEKDSENPL